MIALMLTTTITITPILQERAKKGEITIGDAINLAILEEMLRDPMTTIHAEDLQVINSLFFFLAFWFSYPGTKQSASWSIPIKSVRLIDPAAVTRRNN